MTPKDFDAYCRLMRKHHVLHAVIDGTEITLGPLPSGAPRKGGKKGAERTGEFREEVGDDDDMAFAHTEGLPSQRKADPDA